MMSDRSRFTNHVTGSVVWALVVLSSILFLPVTSSAAPILLGASVSYTENGTNDNAPNSFTISNLSDPGVEILSIMLSLPADTIFDTAGGGSGTSPAHAFAAAAGQLAGGSFALGGGLVPDGAGSLSITFTGFDPGAGFTFTIDVDNTTPTGGGAANIAGRRTVSGAEFAGATILITFGGPFGGSPVALEGVFSETGELTAAATVRQVVDGAASAAVPEPASVGLLGLGALGLAGMRRRLRPRG